MDKYVGKRAARADSFSRRGSGIAFRDHNQEDTSLQSCSRSGCSSSRDSSVRGSQIETPEKPKHTRASFRSISGKAVAGWHSKPFSISTSPRKSFQEQPDQTLVQESAVAGSSSRQQIDDMDSNDEQVPVDNLDSDGRKGRREAIESIPITTKSLKSSLFKGISTEKTKSSNSCGNASSSKVYKQIGGQLVSGNQEASSSSTVPRSTTAPRNSTRVAKSFSQGLGTGAPRCGVKNLSYTSVSDTFPSGYSSSSLIGDRRIDMVRKRPSDGESSAAASRGSNASLNGGYLGSTHTETSVPNLPIPGRILHQPVSRRTRNRPTIRDGAVSFRTQRTSHGDRRMRPSAEGDGSTLPLHVSTITPQLQQTQFSTPEAVRESSSRAFSIDLPHVFNNLSRRPSPSNRVARSRSVSHPDDGSTQIAHGSLGDRHGYRHFNMQGVAEVLLALERIEQDEELTYEQLSALETNLFWGALRFHDQHRDMRMDIDNMSYEELLALEEKMGTVSTALTEEQLSKCLKGSTYTCASLAPGIVAHDNDDVKCSICQEEYVFGDEVGRLPCEHRYHVACIHQWFRRKNWCPVCKSSALPSHETTRN